jgi:cation:H+ antiporter
LDTLSLPIILVIFVFSLGALMKGADYLIDGSSGIAKKLGISDLVIGLTVIALGTSLPELVVSIQAALEGKGGLALANVIGSNSTNILLVIGVTALIHPLKAPRSLRSSEVPFSLILTIAFLVMISISADLYFSSEFNKSQATLPRWGGFLLLGFFAAFVMKLLRTKTEAPAEEAHDEEAVSYPWVKIFVGTALIIAGGKFTVDGAIVIARVIGVSETTIGLTIVSFGTSLPELVASITAARKGFSDMAIGTVIGSNIMNIALVLGTAGAIAPIHIGAFETLDITFMTIVTFIFLGLISRLKAPHINRLTGGIFVAGYTVYMTYVAFR